MTCVRCQPADSSSVPRARRYSSDSPKLPSAPKTLLIIYQFCQSQGAALCALDTPPAQRGPQSEPSTESGSKNPVARRDPLPRHRSSSSSKKATRGSGPTGETSKCQGYTTLEVHTVETSQFAESIGISCLIALVLLAGETWVCVQNAKLQHFHSLLFVFFFARRLVRPALWSLSRRKETAVEYQHRGVISISKQPFHVVKWICHARELQLSNEACAIQQEVRCKSTQELLR